MWKRGRRRGGEEDHEDGSTVWIAGSMGVEECFGFRFSFHILKHLESHGLDVESEYLMELSGLVSEI